MEEEKEMLKNVEHCIKNFNGRMIDCIAVGNMYKKYLEQKAELKKYKNMYKAEHKIHLVRNEQLERKERGIQRALEIQNENIGLKNELELSKKIVHVLVNELLEIVKEQAEDCKLDLKEYFKDTEDIAQRIIIWARKEVEIRNDEGNWKNTEIL